ncbi:DUF6270 domain-containing protein [Telluria mixta]|uniref:DUF6270 domain-containing protein n=1 Tax=Telluria mixta TaxID=34071 RepID=A0ABT2C0Q7_9BURK|nr:DUF6270 domain-containing protein [Telluria mixta]MCS0630972.1 DUF6270 domain-containing protein [Telluria mixta]WEM98970.1 DUF6270 domain-containing protein [Telluria mixta]
MAFRCCPWDDITGEDALTRSCESTPRVLILGSCVSRDILNFAEKGTITLTDYFARSSLASIGSEPFRLEDDHYARISSDFQRRMVRRDLEKTLLHDLSTCQDVDIILIDLIDERFDLYEASPGAVVTVSSEFLMTGLVTSKDRSSERWIRNGSERHRELWKAGVDRLFALLAEHGMADRVVVNRVFWADRMEDGMPLPAQEEKQRETANSLMAWMYGELERYVPERGWMKFSDEVLRSNPAHRWGIAPFHYVDAYYTDALHQLTNMCLAMRQDGALLLKSGELFAWSGKISCPAHRTFFLIFKDNTLVHKQSYSVDRRMRFDTRHLPGNYEVVIFTLVMDSVEPGQMAARRHKSKFAFHIDQVH